MMSGKSIVINMTTISTNRNGIFCFTIFSSDCFDMPWAMNKFMPSGGVRKPMHRLITSVFLRLRSSAQLSKIREAVRLQEAKPRLEQPIQK
jgi:hypothetical protein